MDEYKVKIISNGPYLVCGHLPLEEKIIVFDGSNYKYVQGRAFPQADTYTLCRCGQSRNMPFCDGSHAHIRFDGSEKASGKPFFETAEMFEGSDFILYDSEELCAFARFCHTQLGDTWTLTEDSQDPECREAAIQSACDCPAGRLVIWDKQTGLSVEPVYDKSIVIIQDPSRQCSGPLWVRGGVPVESADGSIYEIRNRVTLCRCGKSRNKPFCDSTHVMTGFNEE